jgi:hypothetical protein
MHAQNGLICAPRSMIADECSLTQIGGYALDASLISLAESW